MRKLCVLLALLIVSIWGSPVFAAYKTPCPYIIIINGDSISTDHVPYNTSATASWPAQLKASLSCDAKIYNTAIIGQVMSQGDTRLTNFVDSIVVPPGVRKVLIDFIGTNDDDAGASTATMLSRKLSTFTNHVSGRGFWKVLVVGSIPRTNQTVTTRLFAWNDALFETTYWASLVALGATDRLDPRTNAAFDAYTDSANGTNYIDTVHLTATGNGIMAGMIKTALGL